MKRFGKPVSAPLWRHRFEPGRLVWQLAFAGQGVLLAVSRSAGSLHAAITALDPSSGRVLAADFRPEGTLEEGGEGFAGIESTSGDLVFCHAWFHQGPEHRGVWAVEAATARVVWSRPELTFAANLGDSLLVYRRTSFAGFPERYYLLLDPASGEVLAEPGSDAGEANRLRSNAPGDELLQGVLLPEPLALEDSRVRALQGLDKLAEGTVAECIAGEGFFALALHEPADGRASWHSSLLVRKAGELLHAASMGSGTPWPSLDNFLLHDGLLYYIERKEQLVCLSVQ